ncbi:MAG TPA: hypothetical protein O0X70_06875, partial [Methanocorpusculum sp.]|nr:hypothetical protein [Methanocorpusculum sp.]
ANYQLPSDATKEFTISPKEITLEWGGTSFTYNGTIQVPEASADGLCEGDTCKVTVTGGEKAAGTHTATATKVSNANYQLPSDATKEFTISPKEITLEWGGTSFTYNGTIQVPEASADGLCEGDTCKVTVTGGEKAAGTYTATATALDNANYTLPEDTTKEYTINPCPLTDSTITVDEIPHQGYTGEPVTPEPVVRFDGNALVKDTDFTVSYTDNTNPGTAKVTITGTDNFKDSIDKTFNIIQTVYTVTVTSSGHGNAAATPDKGESGTEITLTASADDGYIFDKWETDVSITDDKFIMPAKNVTINAVFKKREGTYISGTIENAGGKTVTLKLMLGAKEIASIETTDAAFHFENVANNVYDLVANSDGKTITVIADTSAGSISDIAIHIPSEKISSELEITGKDTPAVAAGNLEKAAEDLKTTRYQTASTLELKLIVKIEDPAETGSEMKKLTEEIKKTNPDAEFIALGIDVELFVDGKQKECTELDKLLEIYIPYDTSRADIAVFRVHEGTAEKLTKIDSKPGTRDGEYYIGTNGIYVYADKFSYYAVSYTPKTPVTSPSGGGKPAEIFVKATVDKGVIGDYGRDATKDVSNWPTDKSSSYKFTVSTVDAAGAAGTLQVQVAGYQAGLWGWGDHDFKMYQVDANGTMTPLTTVYSGEKNGNWQYTAYYTPSGGVDTFVFKPESGATEDKAVAAATTAKPTAKPTAAAPAVQQTAAPVVVEQTAAPTAAATTVATAAATAAAKSAAPLFGAIAGLLGALLVFRRK